MVLKGLALFLAHYLSPILLDLTYSGLASHPSLPSCSSDLLIKVAAVLHHGVYRRHSTASLPLLLYSSSALPSPGTQPSKHIQPVVIMHV